MSDVLPVGSTASTVYPDTGRRSYGAMKTAVCAYFGLDGDSTKELQAGQMIHDIIDDLNMRKLWRFNLYQASDFTSVAGTAAYNLSTVAPLLWKVYSLRKSSDGDYMLTGINQGSFDILFQSQAGITGFPYVRNEFNIFRDGTITMFPPPDGAYTFTLRYFRLIAKPTDDSAGLDMPPPYQVVPYYGAIAQMAALVGHETRSFWETKYERAYTMMNRRDEDVSDEPLRFISTEELASRSLSFLNPSSRPRFLDFF